MKLCACFCFIIDLVAENLSFGFVDFSRLVGYVLIPVRRPEELRVPFERFGLVRDVYIPKDYYTG